MSAKKPTAKQLAARKRFTEMAKNGTLAKKRAAAKKKNGLKAPSRGLVTLCSKTVRVTGRRKKDGTQKKGYIAKPGGKLVKKTTSRKIKL